MHAKKRSKLLNQNKCLMIFYLMLYLFAEFIKKNIMQKLQIFILFRKKINKLL